MSQDKHPLQHLLDVSDYTTFAYSGRGMGDRTCLGVKIPQGDDALVLAAGVIESLGAPYCGPTDHEEVAEAFREARQDSLGKGSVVYFPSIEYVGKEAS